MTCPRCGSETPAASNRCPRCAAPLAPSVATGVLTPPPVGEEAQTQFVDPRAKTARGNQPVPPEALAASPGDEEGQTRVVDPRSPTALHGSQPGDELTAFAGASTIGRATSNIPAALNGPLQPGQAFGTRYQIMRTLGVGGMGAVYEAYDAELGVTVALKVIRPEVMADPIAATEIERRFKRELLLARQVTHKNVVRIHDIGDLNGLKFITMSYVEGADLATIIRRDGALPVPRVLSIARSVAEGLVEAHKQGVVHRDLKPANIMINADDDEAMIMDFGIARSTGGSNAARRSGVRPPPNVVPGTNTIVRNLNRQDLLAAEGTVFGAVVGTVEYMAPEQAQGHHVDQRADIYAFGLILYDLLVGESRSAKAINPIIELQGRMQKAPPAITTIVPEVPEPFAAIIGRCLEPDPDKRFQTSEEVLESLATLDENGLPIPVPPRFSKTMIASAAAVVVALIAGTWWFTRTPPPPKQHDPVSVIIADFQNTTGDPTFSHTLEQALRRALEGAGFITAYDRTRIRAALGARPPDTLDEDAARQLAVKNGVGVVLAGSIGPRGNGYEIFVKATHAMTAKEITSVRNTASGKEQVLATATRLASTVRQALGDDTSASAQLVAMKSISTTSLEVASHYAEAAEAQSKGRFEDALQQLSKAVELDPKFGLGYQGLAVLSRNLGRLQDAEKYSAEALQYLDGMTERERFATRGNYYRMTGDLQRCVEEYGKLIASYPADTVAHNNRALCLSKLRNMRAAVGEMQKLVAILPKRVIYRDNLALYANYASDFASGEREARTVEEPDVFATLALAFSQIGQGLVTDAAASYEKARTISPLGASYAASGLGDLALYEGRFADAARIFEEGAAADLSSLKNPDRAARKLIGLAHVQLLRGQTREAVVTVDQALLKSKSMEIRFLAARVLVDANAIPKARSLADALRSEVGAEPQAYGKLIDGAIALKNRDRQAIAILTDANGVLDTWLGHFDLGRALLESGAFAQADAEFDGCITRRGEALSLLLDEEPTYGHFPMAYYYKGRVREALKNAGFADSYKEYLKIRGASKEDPILPDVRKRAGL
jgi:serine/threonine protein kinase/tetratricopeptide (TPR) repeat protein